MLSPRSERIKSYFGAFLLLIFSFVSVSLFSVESATEYRIGVGDVVQISVWQYEQFNVTAPVGPDGKINIPILGEIFIKGQTKDQVKTEISNRLAKYVKEGAEVTVNITQYNSQKIFIFGQVANSRSISFSTPPSLIEVIIQASPAPDADLKSVKIISGDPSVRESLVVDVEEVIRTGNTSNLPKLIPGDMIYVPKIAPVTPSSPEEPKKESTVARPKAESDKTPEEKFIINVMGAVGSQSILTFSEEPTLIQVLIKSGSVKNDVLLKDISIIRNSATNEEKVVRVDLSKYLIDGDSSVLPRLYNGDLVYIPPLSPDKAQDFSIVIVGEVNKPGSYEVQNPLDILDVISMAGGLSPRADTDRIRIRTQKGNYYLDKIISISDLVENAGSSVQSEMVGPGYRIYVPPKQRNLTVKTAMIARGVVAFLVSLVPIIGLYNLIRD